MNELATWKFLRDKINREKKAALVIVAESSDSSPGRQGFKMAVSLDGKSVGTIGGGILEAKVIKETAAFLEEKRSEEKIITLFHDPKIPAEKSGLICGGSQTVIIKALDETDKETIAEIIGCLENKERKILNVTREKIFLTNAARNNSKYFFEQNFNSYRYAEIIGRAETAYILGGGHVGKEISRILSYLGFYVIVFDERKNLFTLEENDFADKIVIADYSRVASSIDEGELSYVVIVTPKHITDKIALVSVINLNVKYIGMMGSKKKIEAIFELLKKDGIDEKLFEKVHTPIGLPINSETPAEIAISVAAEIIKVKNSGK